MKYKIGSRVFAVIRECDIHTGRVINSIVSGCIEAVRYVRTSNLEALECELELDCGEVIISRLADFTLSGAVSRYHDVLIEERKNLNIMMKSFPIDGDMIPDPIKQSEQDWPMNKKPDFDYRYDHISTSYQGAGGNDE